MWLWSLFTLQYQIHLSVPDIDYRDITRLVSTNQHETNHIKTKEREGERGGAREARLEEEQKKKKNKKKIKEDGNKERE